jgi:hypothetical protein
MEDKIFDSLVNIQRNLEKAYIRKAEQQAEQASFVRKMKEQGF